jgi:hypothetical protein
MVKKAKVRAPHIKMLPASASSRGSLGGRPTKSGTKTGGGGGKGKGKGSGGSAQFV